MNNTKIVATIGPSSYDKAVLKEMFAAGLNVARINFSHSNHQEAKQIFDWVQELNQEEDRNVAVLGDLQGPKLRLGNVEENQKIKKGQEITITTDECIGNSSRIYITYPDFPKDVTVGDRIMLDDGKLILRAESTNERNEVKAKVVQGGELKSKKGVNLPNTKISLPCLTPKDLADLDFSLKIGVEWIGLSFVRNVEDIIELQEIIKKNDSHARVIAKIEKPEAIQQIDEIIMQSDAIMVARGDLGVEVPMERVPNLQKLITRKCIKHSTPVIIATQDRKSVV